jgi:hypothetical protein
MSTIKTILAQITLKQIVSEYVSGGFSDETNQIFNDQNVSVEVVEYSDCHEINFWNEEEELIESLSVKR